MVCRFFFLNINPFYYFTDLMSERIRGASSHIMNAKRKLREAREKLHHHIVGQSTGWIEKNIPYELRNPNSNINRKISAMVQEINRRHPRKRQ